METIKISAWLEKEVDSHSIYAHDSMVKSLKEQTGYDAPWPSYSPEETREGIESRGLGGTLSAEPSEKLAYGYVIAESLARKYTNYDCGFIQGRGSRFWLAFETLQKAGF